MARENFLGVFGHVAIDTICSVKKFPDQNTCEAVVDRRVEFGGTAGNLVLYAAKLGVPTSLASFVGDDFPGAYRERLEESGIDLTDLITVEGSRTSSIIMVSDDAHQQIGFVDQGVMLQQDRMPILEHTLKTSNIIHVGTGRPNYAIKVCQKAKALGKRVAIDPAQEIHYVYTADDFSKIIRLTDMFFCNESELKVSLKYLELKEADELLDFVDTIVITLGKRGSKIMIRNGDPIDIPPIKPKRVVDTTGAGDAYRAGFYAGLNRQLDLKECGIIASAAASFAVEDFGGQNNPPSWEDVQKRASGDESA